MPAGKHPWLVMWYKVVGVGAKCWYLRKLVWAVEKPPRFNGQLHRKKGREAESWNLWLRL
jgi:hypothetical protein